MSIRELSKQEYLMFSRLNNSATNSPGAAISDRSGPPPDRYLRNGNILYFEGRLSQEHSSMSPQPEGEDQLQPQSILGMS